MMQTLNVSLSFKDILPHSQVWNRDRDYESLNAINHFWSGK